MYVVCLILWHIGWFKSVAGPVMFACLLWGILGTIGAGDLQNFVVVCYNEYVFAREYNGFVVRTMYACHWN